MLWYVPPAGNVADAVCLRAPPAAPLNAKSIWLNAVTVASCPGPPASKPTDASPASPELDPDVLPELLVVVPDDPPEVLPDAPPPLVPDPLALPPELPVLDVLPDALPEPLVDEPEPPELVPDPFDVLASAQSPGEDVSQAAEPATMATKETRSVGRTTAS
jgi:hypothetical protein